MIAMAIALAGVCASASCVLVATAFALRRRNDK
jgi:hypothetical protein